MLKRLKWAGKIMELILGPEMIPDDPPIRVGDATGGEKVLTRFALTGVREESAPSTRHFALRSGNREGSPHPRFRLTTQSWVLTARERTSEVSSEVFVLGVVVRFRAVVTENITLRPNG